MADRYFLDSPLSETDQTATLTGAEAHHLIHVMRANRGDRVTLFDGSGAEFAAEVIRLGRSDVQLQIVGREEIDRELATAITLAVALPKGDRQKWLVEKATELGVRRIVPLQTKRSVAQPTGKALERLRRTVVEASKQCRRNRLMEIAEPEQWTAFATDADGAACRVLAHPRGDTPLAKLLADKPTNVLLAIGPEGGFTDQEVAQATNAGWQIANLGERILRIETAAILMAAIASHGA